jgi:hypothetical protein
MAQTPEQRELTNWRSVMASARVTFDGIAVVIQTTVIENTEIKLRRGVAAFGGKSRCFMVLLCIRASKPPGGAGVASELREPPSARSAAIVEPPGYGSSESLTHQLPQVLLHGAEMIKIQSFITSEKIERHWRTQLQSSRQRTTNQLRLSKTEKQ